MRALRPAVIAVQCCLALFVLSGCPETTCPATDAGSCPTCPDAGTPTTGVRILTPAANDSVPIDTLGQFWLGLEVTNFTLKAPGTCAGAANCGHIYVNVDGDRCKASVPGSTTAATFPFNTINWSTAVRASLKPCLSGRADQTTPFKFNGPHLVSVQLVADNGTPLTGASARQEITINATGVIDTLAGCTPAGCDPGPAVTGFSSFKLIEGVRQSDLYAADGGFNLSTQQLYTARFKAAPYQLMPSHYHAGEERITVLAGSIHALTNPGGQTFESYQEDGGGSFIAHQFGYYTQPAGNQTWFFAGPRGVYFQLNGSGTYVAAFNIPSFVPNAIDAGYVTFNGNYNQVNPANPLIAAQIGYCAVNPADGGWLNVDGGCTAPP